MNKDRYASKLDFQKIIEDMSILRGAHGFSCLSDTEQFLSSVKNIKKVHFELTKPIEPSDIITTQKAELSKANQRWLDLIGEATAINSNLEGLNSNLEGLNNPHPTWIKGLDALKENAPDLVLDPNEISIIHLSSMALSKMAYRTTIAEQIFTEIDFGNIHNTLKANTHDLDEFQKTIANMSVSFRMLAESLTDIPKVVAIPDYSLLASSSEMLLTGYALQTICPREEDGDDIFLKEQVQEIQEIRQETNNCHNLLCSIAPELAKLYVGAYDAFNGSNQDRERHILISLRELWSCLLRCLAPDENVIPWASSIDEHLLHKDRPTRKARILYVCRNLNHDPLSDFLVQDTKALVEMVELFNRVHAIDLSLTDEQLYALLLKSDCWITYLLQIQ